MRYKNYINVIFDSSVVQKPPLSVSRRPSFGQLNAVRFSRRTPAACCAVSNTGVRSPDAGIPHVLLVQGNRFLKPHFHSEVQDRGPYRLRRDIDRPPEPRRPRLRPESRPGPVTVLDFIRLDETPVVTRIDRMTKSLQDLRTIAGRIRKKDTGPADTEQPVDTCTAADNALFGILCAAAVFETNLRRGREAERIGSACRGLRQTGTLPALA